MLSFSRAKITRFEEKAVERIDKSADPHLKRQIGEKNVCFTDMIRNVPYFEKIAEYCERQRKE